MHYRTNFLVSVTLRLDFPEIPALKAKQDPALSQQIADRFPLVKPTQLAQISFAIGPGASGIQQQLTGWQWDYRDREQRTKGLVLSANSLTLQYDKIANYTGFETLEDDFAYVFDRFMRLYRVEQFARVGLRYVNDVVIQDGDPLDWNDLISDQLVASVNAVKIDDLDVLRSMHQFSARRRDINMVLNYGILNPEYPNPVARRQFIIDCDCVLSGAVPPGDLLARLTDLNQLAEDVFENCIAQGLRDRMGVIDEH